MQNRPGGVIASRPLYFYWIADCSGSMSLDGKIQALNSSIRDTIPHMREVQEQNPNASVLLRTLRFSNSAAWVQSAPVPLASFQWAELAADDLPQTAEFAAEFRNRLLREGAQTGDVQISLMWSNYNDLDLHVVCPSGEEIYFGHKKSRCNGELDVDKNVSPTSEAPVENVYWPVGGAPIGQYLVYVQHYKNHSRTGCQDPTHFRVGVKVKGVAQEYPGSVSHGQTSLVHTFSLDNGSQAGRAAAVGGGNTNMGKALEMVAEELKIPPMTDRALPPVLVLISDGQPTDDFQAGLRKLMAQPWGKKAIRIAIAIGQQDVDLDILQQFIGHVERRPLQAHNAEQLADQIRWASTAVLKSVSSPASQPEVGSRAGQHVPLPDAPTVGPASANDPW